MFRRCAIAAIVVCACSLAACGIKGPLFLPPPPPAEPVKAAPPAPPASSPAPEPAAPLLKR